MFREGLQIGLYTLVRRIGRGGFGEVWLAERRTEILTTLVAVKLPHSGQVNLEAIRHEAALWAKASGHANVLPIIEANIYDGQVVIVSEYAPDGSLEEKLQQDEEFSVKQTVEMIIGILSGLNFLHNRQIIHRDIKPANILLQDDTPRLADFGISRVINTTALSTSIVGTPKYMAPEAFDGKRSVQTDIWSVGILLYQMLCGDVPFRQENPTEIMWAIVTKEPEPIPASVPPDLRRIVQKALAKLPENRFQSAKEMREELQGALLGISHPTFAPTEILNKPLKLLEDDALTIEDKSIITETPDKQEAAKTQPSPVIQLDEASSEAKETNFEPVSKPLPTEAQKFVELKDHAKKKSNNLFKYIGAAVLGVLAIFGVNRVYVWNQSGKTVTSVNNPYNSNRIPNSNVSSNNSNPNVSNANKNSNISNLANNANVSNSNTSLKTKYDEVGKFENGVAVVKKDGKYGLVDQSGREIVLPYYDLILPFERDTLTPILLNGKVGFIDNRGTLVIPTRYEAVSINQDENFDFPRSPRFSEGGLAPMKLNGKYGFIDREGDEAISFKYDKVSDFDLFGEGIAKVQLNGKIIYIDKNGNEVKKP